MPHAPGPFPLIGIPTGMGMALVATPARSSTGSKRSGRSFSGVVSSSLTSPGSTLSGVTSATVSGVVSAMASPVLAPSLSSSPPSEPQAGAASNAKRSMSNVQRVIEGMT